MEALKMWKNCSLCHSEYPASFESCPNAICQRELQETAARSKFFSDKENKIKLQEMLAIPKRYVGCSTKDFTYHSFQLGRNGIYLFGKPGVGKTHFACIALTEWAWANQTTREAKFVTVRDILHELKDGYSNEGSEREVIDKYASYKALVLDDFGAENTTDWAKSQFLSIISIRYDSCLPTVVTSNLMPPHMTKMEPRIGSRLESFTQVHLKFNGDRRLNERHKRP